MSNTKLLGALATVAMVAGVAGPAAAQEVSTSAGFTIGEDGGVTSVILSSAVSDTFAFSSAVSNTGGVYTEAFASTVDSSNVALREPGAIRFGSAINTTGNPNPTVTILPGPSVILLP
ncbi:MAG: hypothetical protein F6J95_010065 [Leptolyngbya sp. SIO1E4]|nr:hypothetical protein [Leptolyngbya sp. SIO1E4]